MVVFCKKKTSTQTNPPKKGGGKVLPFLILKLKRLIEDYFLLKESCQTLRVKTPYQLGSIYPRLSYIIGWG